MFQVFLRQVPTRALFSVARWPYRICACSVMLIRASGANAPRRRVMSPCRIHASPSIKYFDELAQPIAWGSASEVTALMFAVLASLPVFSTRRASTNLCVSNKRMNAYTCLRLSRINDVESAWDAVRLLRFKGLHWGYRLLQTSWLGAAPSQKCALL